MPFFPFESVNKLGFYVACQRLAPEVQEEYQVFMLPANYQHPKSGKSIKFLWCLITIATFNIIR
ncbi:hypothetical protein GCM10007362_19970 [Saccharibacillus endophyticus]|uniref:Uncharacterized protein n=1 Tax=Saccharibacillus endophyticus TaxID=2060666 RepID=A0ABQ1ZRL8_9BACL|nr:hypothetical protein GCM10007362_19970 [Saccharibacillus endophyticus]